MEWKVLISRQAVSKFVSINTKLFYTNYPDLIRTLNAHEQGITTE